MDVQSILENKIKQLPPGEHLDGLRAVKSHIESAVRHLARGQKGSDETLFTDAIYRCNQAFEGSIKEAFRVLAGKNPEKKTPAEIERFLISGNLLRKKVLDQLVNYRKEWRNPSTHDHMLDFDEDEALIAIVSVTVFAILLCDQIDTKIAFDKAASASQSAGAVDPVLPLLDQVAAKLMSFAAHHVETEDLDQATRHDYYRLEGALAGYISAEFSGSEDLSVTQHERMSGYEADVVVKRGSEKIVIELKTTRRRAGASALVQRAVGQAAIYLHAPEVSGAVVLIYSASERDYTIRPATGALGQSVRIVAPVDAL